MDSGRFQLTQADVKKWLTDSAYFLIPGILIFMGAIQMGVQPKDAGIALYGWALNAIMNLLRKWYTDHSPSN